MKMALPGPIKDEIAGLCLLGLTIEYEYFFPTDHIIPKMWLHKLDPWLVWVKHNSKCYTLQLNITLS